MGSIQTSSSSSNGSASSYESSDDHAIKGSEWTYKIYFDPNADIKDETIHEFTERELMNKLKDLVGVNEQIDKVEKCKHKLWWLQLTYFIFYHMFILFKTKSYWWTIEKNSQGITIQRSKHRDAVEKRYRCEDRLHVKRKEIKSGHCNVYDLIGWLYKSNELNREYHFWKSNCQHFGNAVFNRVAEIKIRRIFFDKRVDEDDQGGICELTDDEFMSVLKDLEGNNEVIQTIEQYTTKVHRRRQGKRMRTCTFILLKTSLRCWNIEQTADRITIQRRTDYHVMNKYRQTRKVTVHGFCTILDLMNQLYKSNQLINSHKAVIYQSIFDFVDRINNTYSWNVYVEGEFVSQYINTWI